MSEVIPTVEMVGTKTVRGEGGDHIDVDEGDDEMLSSKRKGDTGSAAGKRAPQGKRQTVCKSIPGLESGRSADPRTRGTKQAREAGEWLKTVRCSDRRL